MSQPQKPLILPYKKSFFSFFLRLFRKGKAFLVDRDPNPKTNLLSIFRFAICLFLTHLRLIFLPHRFNRKWNAPEPSNSTQIGSLLDQSIRARLLLELLVAAKLAPKDATCLRRSLCLKQRFKSLGLEARLVYGIKKSHQGAVLAHAWVESAGKRWDGYGSAAGYQSLKRAHPKP